MKTSRSRNFSFLLLFIFVLASSVPVMQTALGSSQVAGWVDQIYLPLVMNDNLSLLTATPTFTATPTRTPTNTTTLTPTFTSTPTQTLTNSATPTPTNTTTLTPTNTTTLTPSFTSTSTCSPSSSSTPTRTPTGTATPTGTSMPTLKLTVTQSPLTIYPPIMIYTAQLSYVPPTSSAQLKVDFYNLAGTKVEYLGWAPVNQTGQAVLSKQIYPGTYTAIARVVINSQVIWSNIVTYKVL